jgi:Sec-independent protein translocase protein TatA
MGSGGLGAVSIDVSGWLVILVIALLVLFGAWKIAKLIWAAFSG